MAASRTDARQRVSTGTVKRKRTWKKRLAVFSRWAVIVGSVGFLYGWWTWRNALIEADGLMPNIENKLAAMRAAPSQILTSDGHVLYEASNEFRESIKLAEVKQPAQDYIRNAMLAAEDRRFYEHHGVDFTAIARVGFLGAKEGRLGQGGSTLTMQLAKRMHSQGERTFHRKLLDMAIASEMEDKWPKEHILDLYLNQVYFGSGAYGIGAAAQIYFGKSVDKLTLAEAAMLARCVRTPGKENPFQDPRGLKVNEAGNKSVENRNLVLKTMRDDGKITPQQFDEARSEKVHLNRHRRDAAGHPEIAPYVVMAVMAELKERCPDVHFGEGGVTVKTTIDWDMQMAAERAVHNVVARYSREKVNNAAFVLMTGDGRILAEVGGANFKKDEFNVVTQGHRQPGSSFKPIVYSTALAKGALNLDSSISNERLFYKDPSTGRPYSPRNDNGKYGGMVSLTSAVAFSINTPAVRTLLDVGIDNVVTFGHDVFGIKSELPAYPSLALGACSVSPLEMAEAYAVFNDRGSRPTPFLVSKVTTYDGTSGDGIVELENTPNMARNVLDAGVCDDINVLLRAVVEHGTATRAADVPDARGKTGTTSDNKDAWFCGSANGLIGVGWVGNDVYSKKLKHSIPMPMMSSVFGGTVTVTMWAEVEKAAYAKFKTHFQTSEARDDGREALSRPEKKVEDPGDLAIPPDGAATPTTPNPNGSPDQQIPPVTNDPGVIAKGGDHGQDPGKQAPPPPLQDPTEAQPKQIDPPVVTPVRAPSHPRTTPRVPKTQDTEYVEVEICADTGELATDYCPETVTRRFVKGRQPKRHCHLHRG